MAPVGWQWKSGRRLQHKLAGMVRYTAREQRIYRWAVLGLGVSFVVLVQGAVLVGTHHVVGFWVFAAGGLGGVACLIMGEMNDRRVVRRVAEETAGPEECSPVRTVRRSLFLGASSVLDLAGSATYRAARCSLPRHRASDWDAVLTTEAETAGPWRSSDHTETTVEDQW